ncbi:hypothetical protein HGRIS_007563 [Hohenbuehelia grisea]|uniref:C2H2-type domain-containing protein n=1 Tax=Hohenbuehelia grisea TaxID=104357 RepID=A0ABR3J584_9AGAR
MSSYPTAQYPAPFETFASDQLLKQQLQGFPTLEDIPAPAPDLFESDLDFSLAGFDQAELQVLAYDSSDAFAFLRSDTPTCGPLSAITASSESLSAYDDRSSQSESVYSYSPSGHSSSNNFYPLDLTMDFQKFSVDDYAGFPAAQPGIGHTVDPTSFGTLPPTPPRSPELSASGYQSRSSFSDYGPSSRKVSAEYYSPSPSYAASAVGQPTVSPSNVSAQLSVPAIPLPRSDGSAKGDPRRKYRCNVCQRSFARAFNLKTHMNTHDPNRPKPFVCPHRSCGRSFSRKHDLGRHLISIHRDDSVCSSHHSASSKKPVGVERGGRTWCDSCGKGFIGAEAGCDCHDVK